MTSVSQENPSCGGIMPVYHAVGPSLVTDSELREKSVELAEFSRRLESRDRDARLSLSTGTLRAEAMLESAQPTFQPIGLHKPLTVMFHHVYTGQFPRSAFFDNTKDMLVTSAMKDLTVTSAQPRALNFLRGQVKAGHNTNTPAATEEGTPLITYSPAVTVPASILTMEIVFDNFPDALLNRIGTAFGSAAGIPIFAPAAPYLMAAGVVMRLAADLGKALFDGQPAFRESVTLNFDLPQLPLTQADFRVVAPPDFDVEPFSVDPVKGLVRKDGGQRYDGPFPYVILALDGRRRDDEFGQFAPAALTAAQLERFLSAKDGAEVAVDTLLESLKLFNDVRFRSQADALKRKIDRDCADSDSEECRKLKERHRALLDNVLSDTLKPAVGE
jgi:hypothetical protein